MRIHLHRLLKAPTARIESVEGDVTRLRIDGLVCDDLCAARTRDALEGMDGVRAVTVDFESGSATVTGAPLDAAAYDGALQRAVIGGSIRRAIERFSRRMSSRPQREVSR